MHTKSNKHSHPTWALLALAVTSACSGGEAKPAPSTTNLEKVAGPAITENPVGFRLQMTGLAGAAPSFTVAADTPLDAGTFEVTMAVVNLRHVELKVPEGWDCGEYSDESDDDVETEDEAETEDETQEAEDAEDTQDDSSDTEDETEVEDSAALAAAPALAPDESVSSDADSSDDGIEDEVRVAACDGASGEDEIRFEGPFTVDLLTGLSTPSLDNLAVPPGTYKRVDLRVDDLQAEDTTQSSELVGHSLIAYGTYTTDTATPVRLALKFNEDIRFETPDGFTISETGGTDIVASINSQNWFAGVGAAIAACLTEKEDDALIGGVLNFDESDDNATECGEVEELLKESFKNSGDLSHEDHDQDEDDGQDDAGTEDTEDSETDN